MNVLYLGFNSFNDHKRGVENVIDFQSRSTTFEKIFYLHWGEKTYVYKNGALMCISIKHCWYWPFLLNIIILKFKKKFDLIIHSHNPLLSFFLISKTHILTVHDALYYSNKSKQRKFTLHFWIIEFLLYFKCDLVHFVSDYSKQQSLFGKRNNYIIIPNTSHFEPLSNKTEKFVFQGYKSVLVVRSIEKRARIDLLIQVAENFVNLEEFHFTVAGKGPLLNHYRNEIQNKKLKNIEFLGYVSDDELINLYRNCDIVLVLAEYGEGFGLPIIEGYLFNKPVIASNKCAIPEIIIDKSFLFENQLGDIIDKLTNKSQVNLNFRNYYDHKYSNQIILNKFKSLYYKMSS